jgi:predicted Zn-dependent protease
VLVDLLLLFLIPVFSAGDMALDQSAVLSDTVPVMKYAREIAPTAPLYPEMSQILSMASLACTESAELARRGRAEEALISLQDAEKKVRGLQRLYPSNTLAASLLVRIRRGLETAGFRRSLELCEEARSLVNSGRDEITLRRALAAAERAVALDPGNAQGLLLKDQALTLLGNRLAASMSLQDEMRYAQAVSAFQAGNLLEAKALVEQLLAAPGNQQVYRVIDLRTRLDFLL